MHPRDVVLDRDGRWLLGVELSDDSSVLDVALRWVGRQRLVRRRSRSRRTDEASIPCESIVRGLDQDLLDVINSIWGVPGSLAGGVGGTFPVRSMMVSSWSHMSLSAPSGLREKMSIMLGSGARGRRFVAQGPGLTGRQAFLTPVPGSLLERRDRQDRSLSKTKPEAFHLSPAIHAWTGGWFGSLVHRLENTKQSWDDWIPAVDVRAGASQDEAKRRWADEKAQVRRPTTHQQWQRRVSKLSACRMPR